jgi:hypothetical protein
MHSVQQTITIFLVSHTDVSTRPTLTNIMGTLCRTHTGSRVLSFTVGQHQQGGTGSKLFVAKLPQAPQISIYLWGRGWCAWRHVRQGLLLLVGQHPQGRG